MLPCLRVNRRCTRATNRAKSFRTLANMNISELLPAVLCQFLSVLQLSSAIKMTKFIICVAVCTLIGGSVVRADNSELIKINVECAKEFSITPERMKKLHQMNFEEIEPNENLKV